MSLRRVPGHLRPRRLRVYGVGNGKSGTTSFTEMFDWYRSEHEIDSVRIRALGTRVLTGELNANSARVRAALRRRSLRYHLEVDCAGNLSLYAGTLAQMYADAKFVLLIRDCFSWLNSFMDQQIRDLSAGPLTRDSFFKAKYMSHNDPFASEEAVLRDAGLLPIASWLRAWAGMNERVLGSVPPDRLRVVRTEDLDDSTEMLARFVGVPTSTVRPVHTNRNPSPTGVLGQVPRSFVIAQARTYCAPLMQRFWGADWCELSSRIPGTPTA